MFLHPDSDAPALIDPTGGRCLSHRDLAATVESLAPVFRGRALAFLFATNTPDSVVAYLAALSARCPVALLDPGLRPNQAQYLLDLYEPSVVVDPPAGVDVVDGTRDGHSGLWVADRRGPEAHRDLAVLLSTSGSTGSPKLVRLSRENLRANSSAIIGSLAIRSSDRAILNLPLHYSYGMSVLNTHLDAGASVVVTDASVVDEQFWDAVRRYEPTSLAGVPSTFQTLRRLGLEKLDADSIRVLTQAGGKLEDRLVEHFHELMTSRRGKFHVMYGQTEAAPRIACLPSQMLPEKLGSVGPPLGVGRISIRNDNGEDVAPGLTGSVVYDGPNVMMGYAESPADLELGDVHGDRLETGDLGYLDADGCLYLTGRTKRIAKVFGLRVSLDEVEGMLRGRGPTVVVAGQEDTLMAFCEWGDDEQFASERRALGHQLRLSPSALVFRRIDTLPTLTNGKIDYRALEAQAGQK